MAATTYLRRTPGGSGNQRKFTFSFWVKKNSVNPAGTYTLFDCGTSSNYFHIYFPDTHTLTVKARASNSTVMELVTTRVFRDPSAWYNIVIAVDSEQGTAANRAKIYVNGVQETSFSSEDFGAQNQDYEIQDTGSYHYIGTNYAVNADEFFDGSMSYVAFVDGTQELPTIFGETDTDTGEWKIKTSITPSSAWGSNGFFILKNGNSVTDQSGQSNNWVVQAGTLTDLEDSPSNSFSTMNPVVRLASGSNAYSQVNNTFTDASGSYNTCFSTLGMFNGQGKYYAEFKVVSGTSLLFGIADYKESGVIDRIQRGENRYLGEYANSYGYQRNGNFYYNGSSTSTGYDSFTTNDIIGLAVDMDNLKIYWHKNGTYQNSKNPASNNGETIVAPTEAYHMSISAASSAANVNFGNGIFGTTAISSAGTNAAGNGVFEYDVPSGYTALSTKGLNL